MRRLRDMDLTSVSSPRQPLARWKRKSVALWCLSLCTAGGNEQLEQGNCVRHLCLGPMKAEGRQRS